jgi:hypothetical protein
MPRAAQLDSPGTLHHLIIRGIEQRRIVDDEIDRGHSYFRESEIGKHPISEYSASKQDEA